MTIDVVAATRIERPRAEVANFVSDPVNDPKWIGGISEARLLTPAPLGKDSKVERVAGMMGHRIEYTTEVVEYEPESLVAMKSIKGPFPMRVTYRLADSEPGGTLVEVRNQGGPGGVMGLASPLLAMIVRRNVGRDLATLKRLMESPNR